MAYDIDYTDFYLQGSRAGTVAERYKQSRLSTGEEYLTQQKFGLIPDEMKEQLGLVGDIKKQNPSMLNFMNVPTADDVFLFDKAFKDRKNIQGITGLSYAPISKGGYGREGGVPHPWITTAAQFEDKPWEIPASDPRWQNVVSTESKISVAPGSKADTLMHEQIHLDIRDLVMSGDLSEENFRKLDRQTEEALINYLVLQSGIELNHGVESWLKGLVKSYRTKNNLSEDALEERLEGWIDILNDAKRSRTDYGGQQDILEQESTRRYQESLSPATLEKLNTPMMQVVPTEPGSQDLLSPKLQQMMDDLINSIAGWSDEEIANIYGTSVEYVQQRRQEIQPQEAEVTQETATQPSLIDRLKGLLPQARTESGMVEPPVGPGYLPGQQSVGEAMSTPLDLSEAALEGSQIRRHTRTRPLEPYISSPEYERREQILPFDLEIPNDIDSLEEYKIIIDSLKDVGGYNLGSGTLKALGDKRPFYSDRALLAPDAADAFNTMKDDYGNDIPIESAFRSVRHNEVLPGHAGKSQHLKGLALDITDSGAKAWMAKHGSEYGWILADYKRKDGTQNTTHFNFKGVPEPWT